MIDFMEDYYFGNQILLVVLLQEHVVIMAMIIRLRVVDVIAQQIQKMGVDETLLVIVYDVMKLQEIGDTRDTSDTSDTSVIMI